MKVVHHGSCARLVFPLSGATLSIFRPEPATCSQIAPFRIFADEPPPWAVNAMSFSAEVWSLARLCCMYPVLGGLAIWYFSRADRLLHAILSIEH
ncbi:hypothetical protein [Paraburkholderia agricolaris]|uniref:hypothetical protein n=1 Tax=Paraburkholderia agricolaris TaxID=2152888 RepID=UPI0012925BB7|nr:hypothetical protein [Paraburkholderia agricolaris]